MIDERPATRAARLFPAVLIMIAIGLALRIAAARGGLWLDEAWSAKLAQEAGTPLGVFLHINHDNNHHLNTLWMQLVGIGAPPLLARALSIASGTIGIAVAARIAAPRGMAAALVAATLFALSPILVTYGSEARGYAPMILALLLAILIVDRWLAGTADPHARRRLAWCFALGALAQLTMVFGCVAIVGWATFVEWRRRRSLVAAVGTVLRFFLPGLVALAIVLGIVFGAAYASPTGFQFGRYDPFDFLLYLHGVVEMFGYTLGYPIVSLWVLAVAAIAVVLGRGAGTARFDLYWIAIVAFPVGMAVLRAGNVGNPRYFLLAGVALLLMLGDIIARGLVAHRPLRAVSAGVFAAFVVGSVAQDADLIANQRGDPAAAVRAMAARAPAGADVALDRDTGLAMVETAAAQARYRVVIRRGECPAARFLFVDRFKGETPPTHAARCGTSYRAIAQARAHGMSGTHWTLFERID